MASFTNDAEGGTSGSNVATTDTGSGTQWNNVVSTGSALSYSTTQAMHGSKSIKMVSFSGDSYCQWTLGAAAKQASFRFYLYIDTAAGSGDIRVFSISSSTTQYLNFTLRGGTAKFVISNNAGTAIWTSTGSWSTGTWYRIEGSLDTTAGGSAAVVVLNTYLGDGTSAISNLSWSASAQTTGGSTYAYCEVGQRAGTQAGWTLYFDDIALNESTTTAIGPSSTPAVTANPTCPTPAAAANNPRPSIAIYPAVA